MKHIFIINPKAGKGEAYSRFMPSIIKEIKNFKDKIEYKIHITTGKNDAKRFCKKLCMLRKNNEILRFYACGGDGTLNEVVNGVYGYNNVEVACIPSGSGNDFVKNFDNANFTDIKSQIEGKSINIDLLSCKIDSGSRLGVNIVNTGLDCDVVKYMESGKENAIKFLGGKGLYIYGAMRVFFDMKYIDVEISSEKLNYKGEATLLAFGNGQTYGGGFRALPFAKVNDNQMDICLVKKINRKDFLKLIGAYKKGEHLNIESAKDIISYEKVQSVKLKSDKKLTIAIDGELIESKELKIEVIHNAISFVLPK